MSKMVDRVVKAIMEEETGEPGQYEAMARAAIKAMREPTDPMICAVLDLHDSAPRTFRVSEDWRAMIDEALK